jgi:hypothetical protein
MTLATAIAALQQILARENAALEKNDFVSAGHLLAAKQTAAENLAAALRDSGIEAATKAALTELAQTAGENRALLARAMRVQRRVIALVTTAARGNTPSPHYGAKTIRPPPRALSRRL